MHEPRLTTLIDETLDRFAGRYGRQATNAAMSPGRVNLIGDHTDYSDGFAMPFAINRYVAVCAAPREDDQIHVYSTEGDVASVIELGDTPIARLGDWSDYVRGVVQGLREHDIDLRGADIMLHGDLPGGAGLSSSAALEVAIAKLMLAMADQILDDDTLILLTQAAEHRYPQMPCGSLDQFSVITSRAGRLAVFDSRSRTGTLVDIADSALAFMVINSNIKHDLAEGEYAQRRMQLETIQKMLGKSLRDTTTAEIESSVNNDLLVRRGRHVTNENRRVQEMGAALSDGDNRRAGSLMFASHGSLRDDFEVTCPETDLLVALASELTGQGVVGARQTGGGFGGAVIALIDRTQADDIAAMLTDRYLHATGIDADVLMVHPVDGATALDPGFRP